MQFDNALTQLQILQQRMVEIADQQDWQQLAIVESECQQLTQVLTEWPDLSVLQMERLRRHLLAMTATYRQLLGVSFAHMQRGLGIPLAG